MTNIVDREMLLGFARSFEGKSKCADCQSLSCAGWESIPGGFITNALECIGTLRVEDAPENWEEHHPKGTTIWSKDAPISISFHPYNKSDIYECKSCGCKYLRYTECGGYYVDERIRELNRHLIT
ncbi:MAG: hypothetical protein WCP25_05510 [Polynucleobacter sp.]|jgi:hypothetical protein